MRQSTRLVVNSLAMFARMAITVGMGLLAVRLQLLWLGRIDYGTIEAVGAVGALIQFVVPAMTISIQRHLAYEIGRGDQVQLIKVFNTSLLFYATVALGLWSLGQLLAPLVMRINLPHDRLDAAWWVYQCSLLNVVVVMLASPFQSLVVAHQRLIINAVVDLFSMASLLAAVFLLLVVPGDKMIAMATMQLIGFTLVRVVFVSWSCWRYPESRPRPSQFDRNQLKPIASFISWSVLGNLSWLLRMQSAVLMFTFFFGAEMAAAFGPARKVAGYVINFSQAIRLAVLPAIVVAEAKGNRANTHRLAMVAGKYTLLLLTLGFIPIWIEAEQVLAWWLKEVPPYTFIFVRLILIWTLINVFFSGYALALMGTGNIGWFMRRTLAVDTSALLVSGLAFYWGKPPWVLPAVTIVAVLLLTWNAVAGVGKQIELSPRRWVRESLLPTLAVLVPASVAAAGVHFAMDTGLWRVLAVGGAYGVVAIPMIWFVGLADWERNQFLRIFQSGLAKLAGRS